MLDINKQAMKYSLQGQTVTIYDTPIQRVTLFLILMITATRYLKFLKKKLVFQSQLILKQIFHSAVEKHKAKNTALIPLILTLFC